MSIQTQFKTNISGKVRNTRLPKRKALWPLFEIISNSIHAIEENSDLKKGKIEINLTRNGHPDILKEERDIEKYPINSFEIIDNGVGFTDVNLNSFLTAESDYKIEKGAKGIGRFVALKAFRSVHYRSNFSKAEEVIKRSFIFKAQGKGIFDYHEEPTKDKQIGTSVLLNNFKHDYQKYSPSTLGNLAEQIVTHFLIYFILEKAPLIYLKDVNGNELLLQNYYATTIKGSIKNTEFTIRDSPFKVWLLRAFNTRTTHTIHYCANDREVKKDNLSKYIPDLGRRIEEEKGNYFVYHAYITGSFLDDNVDSDRTDFSLHKEEDIDEGEENIDEITLRNIRRRGVESIEKLLASYLEKVRLKKFQAYEQHINEAAPQFKAVLKYEPQTIKRMPPNLKGNKLDIELFKVQNKLEASVKELGEQIFNGDDDFKNSEDYQSKYTEYFEKFNEVGKANLAKYIVHRKAVIDLLDKFIGFDENDNLQTEDTIHNIFFPIRTESDEINYNQQNLWLIDERLSYHHYLASDKAFKKIPITDSNSLDRPDLLIFNNSFAFVEDDAPHNSYTIVEFKRPERKNYSSNDAKKNPVDQVIKYIRTIRGNKATDRKGKRVQFIGDNVPFYAYIIADFNTNLEDILEERDFKKTPDGMGYFRFHDKYNAYIEVITYQKVLKDAKNRNRILFDKLGLPTN